MCPTGTRKIVEAVIFPKMKDGCNHFTTFLMDLTLLFVTSCSSPGCRGIEVHIYSSNSEGHIEFPEKNLITSSYLESNRTHGRQAMSLLADHV